MFESKAIANLNTLQAPVANVIKLFTAVSYAFSNKLERLCLSSLNSLVNVCG